MRFYHALVLLLILSTALELFGQPEELGSVNWLRDYDQALLNAKEKGKPILILFQEVPGCATCRNYGYDVLSHPLMVEAIENEFIPLAIYNNKGGRDKEILDLYREPSWNNPVVRIVDENGKDIIDRLAQDYSARALHGAINLALTRSGKQVPEFINVLGEELRLNSNTKEEIYEMYCFWSGQEHFGKIDGVLNTEAGFMGGHEVVKVRFNETIIKKDELNQKAKSAKYKNVLKDNTYRVASKDNYYHLKKTNFRFIPLTPLQKSRINSFWHDRIACYSFLSPKQMNWLEKIEEQPSSKRKSRIEQDFISAWNEMED
ncbi:MAG: thioredoxin family protein [Flavobacteriales bacterium]|nr:thioredoxin family protein [Flavobacteriales bacterium]